MMNNTALITGSTSGIGEAFTNILAKEGFNLVLVSRDLEKLNVQKKKLSQIFRISAYIIPYDLEQPNAANFIYQRTQDLGVQIDFLINNAGFNEYGNFLSTDRKKEREMIELHTVFPTEMMKLFVPGMVHRKKGRVLNVGSTGSFISCPRDAVYAATKSYILSVSKAIAAELKGTGVSITALCPGSTNTEFAKKAGMEKTLLFKLFVMRSEAVAKIGYHAAMNGRVKVVPGFYNKLLVLSSRLLPDKLITFLTQKML